MSVLEAFYTIYSFIAQLGGFLAFIIIGIALYRAATKSSDEEEEE